MFLRHMIDFQFYDETGIVTFLKTPGFWRLRFLTTGARLILQRNKCADYIRL
tara:strand:+ start:490 stop:645 length:156 start_codon:yes stop_codon:yes gene_type:complete